MPRISVIVPCYNAEAYVMATVESVLLQTFHDWELVLVDDGSKDGTFAAITQLAGRDPRIQAFSKPNGGASSARNYGFERSAPNSEYLFFLDSDDQLVPQALARMAAYLEANPQAGLVTCQFEDVSAKGERLGTGHRSRWAPGWFFPRKMRDDENVTPFEVFFCAQGQGPFALFRRRVYEKTNGWDTSFFPHDDTDIFCQMALISELHYMPDRLYLKRQHPSQITQDHHRIQSAYGQFRRKWDNLVVADQDQAQRLARGRIYYRSRHRPTRDLFVASHSLRAAVTRGQLSSLRHGLELIASAFRGYFFGALRR